MVSTFTPNINLEEPARGDDVGTWDTPVNSNMTVLDLVTGANTTINIGSGNVTLSIAQYRSNSLTLSSTLIQNTTIAFPSTFMKPYLVGHLATGSSAFTLTLATTVSGGQVVAIPPGEYVNVFNDGTNIKFGTLARVGTYWDYAGSSVPNWVSACTVPPYLNCDGTTFSSSTYPQLNVIIGGTTLPDFRGRLPAYLNQGTGRLTSAGAGINGNTNFSNGGSNGATLTAAMVPSLTATGTFASAQTGVPLDAQSFLGLPTDNNAFGVIGANGGGTPITCGQVTGSVSATYSNGAQVVVPSALPVEVGGLRMIRAA